ncbi:MAG TPA: hypothetical protein VFJ79_01885 [Acidimicrobiales bacterium]|nr:hypothetical protein [Acidimicrobiales bacterium]
MSFAIDGSDIHLNNPYSAGQSVSFEFEVHNTSGMNTTGHNVDHVDVIDNGGAKVLDQDFQGMAVGSGQSYRTIVQGPVLGAGTYDVVVNVDGGAARAGATIIVQ